MRDGGNDHLIALNGIDQIVRKAAQRKFALFIIHYSGSTF
jgi:hypothetical protein